MDDRVPKTKKVKDKKIADLGDGTKVKTSNKSSLNQRVLPFKDQAEFYDSDASDNSDVQLKRQQDEIKLPDLRTQWQSIPNMMSQLEKSFIALSERVKPD